MLVLTHRFHYSYFSVHAYFDAVAPRRGSKTRRARPATVAYRRFRSASRSSGRRWISFECLNQLKKTPRLTLFVFRVCSSFPPLGLSLLRSCLHAPYRPVRSLTLEKPRPLSENKRIVVSVPFISRMRVRMSICPRLHLSTVVSCHALVQAVFRRRVALARREQSGHARLNPVRFQGVTLDCSLPPSIS